MRTLVVVSLAASLGVALPAIVFAQEFAARPRPASGTVLRGLVYQPRGAYGGPYHHSSPPAFSQGYFDMHGGVFRINGTDALASDFGGKMAFSLAPSLRLGMLLDWQHRSESQTAVISSGPGPGGITITNQLDLGSGSSDLVPFMGFLELEPAPKLMVSPYIGGAAGYEWLSLHASRSDIPVPFEASYGGFGWQAWGGVAMRLSPAVRLNAEVYGNFGEVSRDAFDTTLNAVVKETVSIEGAGVRGGLQFGF